MPANDIIRGIGPAYTWNENFRTDDVIRSIDSLNATVNHELTENVTTVLRVQAGEALCRWLNYLRSSRLIENHAVSEYSQVPVRVLVYGPDLCAVQEKLITLPVLVSNGLEVYLRTLMDALLDISVQPEKLSSVLVPIHGYLDSPSAMPGLLATPDAEPLNVRLWVINQKMMWAGQDRVLNEFTELVWTLFYLFRSGPAHQRGDHANANLMVARTYRRRIFLPDVPNDEELTTFGAPTLRESLLFRHWVLDALKDSNSPSTP